MRLEVSVVPHASRMAVERVGQMALKVWVRELAEDGQANRAMVKAVARYLNIPSLDVMLVSGHTSKHKVVEVAVDRLPEWHEQRSLL